MLWLLASAVAVISGAKSDGYADILVRRDNADINGVQADFLLATFSQQVAACYVIPLKDYLETTIEEIEGNCLPRIVNSDKRNILAAHIPSLRSCTVALQKNCLGAFDEMLSQMAGICALLTLMRALLKNVLLNIDPTKPLDRNFPLDLDDAMLGSVYAILNLVYTRVHDMAFRIVDELHELLLKDMLINFQVQSKAVSSSTEAPPYGQCRESSSRPVSDACCPVGHEESNQSCDRREPPPLEPSLEDASFPDPPAGYSVPRNSLALSQTLCRFLAKCSYLESLTPHLMANLRVLSDYPLTKSHFMHPAASATLSSLSTQLSMHEGTLLSSLLPLLSHIIEAYKSQEDIIDEFCACYLGLKPEYHLKVSPSAAAVPKVPPDSAPASIMKKMGISSLVRSLSRTGNEHLVVSTMWALQIPLLLKFWRILVQLLLRNGGWDYWLPPFPSTIVSSSNNNNGLMKVSSFPRGPYIFEGTTKAALQFRLRSMQLYLPYLSLSQEKVKNSSNYKKICEMNLLLKELWCRLESARLGLSTKVKSLVSSRKHIYTVIGRLRRENVEKRRKCEHLRSYVWPMVSNHESINNLLLK